MPPPPSSRQTTAATTTTSPSTLLPKPAEALLLAAYPLTLLLGSLTSVLSPTLRASPYYTLTQSHAQEPQLAPSYFARKNNILNVYFVKLGWFWTTLALLAATSAHPRLGAPLRATRARVRAWARWGVATLVWVATTQWCFGPPLIDRGFRLTGGQCVLLEEKMAREGWDDGSARRAFEEVVTATACKVAGGRWQGGHDISGHVFLLVLGSAVLLLELAPLLAGGEGGSGAVDEAEVLEKRETFGESQAVAKYGVRTALAVVGLMWWMLLMTATFFHTWTEKFAGLVVAFLGIWLAYIMPRGVPAVRAVLGTPGV